MPDFAGGFALAIQFNSDVGFDSRAYQVNLQASCNGDAFSARQMVICASLTSIFHATGFDPTLLYVGSPNNPYQWLSDGVSGEFMTVHTMIRRF